MGLKLTRDITVYIVDLMSLPLIITEIITFSILWILTHLAIAIEILLHYQEDSLKLSEMMRKSKFTTTVHTIILSSLKSGAKSPPKPPTSPNTPSV